MEWHKSEENRSCIIRKQYETGGYANEEEKRDEIHDEAVDGMVKFERALQDYIDKLQTYGYSMYTFIEKTNHTNNTPYPLNRKR